jgi:trigger factor
MTDEPSTQGDALPQDEDMPVGEEGLEDVELSEDEKLMAQLKEAIDVQQEEIAPLRLKLTISVPRDVMSERMDEQFRELKREAAVPGFRKGRAPLRLVEKRFGSEVGDQLVTQLVSSGYMAAIEKEELKPISDPVLWVTAPEERADEKGILRMIDVDRLLPLEEAIEHIRMPDQGPLVFSCELELKPEFELPNLEEITVTPPELEIGDKEVDTELERMRKWRGSFEPVDEGAAVELDDMLIASLTMMVDGELIKQEDSFDLAARDVRVSGVPLRGFGDAVKGKKVGDTLTFEAPVPDDHSSVDIQGKQAHFSFVLQEVKRLAVPPMDDEFVQSVGFDSVDELREAMRANLEQQRDQNSRRMMRDQVLDYLTEKTSLQVPEGMSQRQADRIISRQMFDMYRRGMSQEEIRKEVDALEAAAKEQSERELKAYFILERVAEDLDVTVGEEEINSAIASIAQQQNRRFDRVRDELSKNDGIMSLYLQLRDEKLLDLLVEAALARAGGGSE